MTRDWSNTKPKWRFDTSDEYRSITIKAETKWTIDDYHAVLCVERVKFEIKFYSEKYVSKLLQNYSK